MTHRRAVCDEIPSARPIARSDSYHTPSQQTDCGVVGNVAEIARSASHPCFFSRTRTASADIPTAFASAATAGYRTP